ncbi:hypothetical protein DU86_00830 [Methanosarcina mazei]|uniref:Uncharacterized protein n=1 Tax=Methanosarcina mazei TaxID=2209 RepID=A0A0F8GFH1_METMZ|nr:hypothetical protein DU31_00645 [Methanosarcina mazei]KKG56853.1 hypothetical protein DU33_17430 [Methanosarcina mazei]KKG58891.1 hypothetical protein DU45_18110 [Methanosarcina mazei]KKG63151.1 hypothetical protein DU64_18445 [Methanosarcina mazei]KKG96219.1 hypothetical protein DU66_19590 [Methanosarcina mazei]
MDPEFYLLTGRKSCIWKTICIRRTVKRLINLQYFLWKATFKLYNIPGIVTVQNSQVIPGI